jgi:hypothetical protein
MMTFASCFTMGKGDGWGTFPNIRGLGQCENGGVDLTVAFVIGPLLLRMHPPGGAFTLHKELQETHVVDCTRHLELGTESIVPLITHRHDPAPVHSNLQKRRHGHIEMLERPVAPPAIVVGETGIGGTEICCCHRYRSARQAPLAPLTYNLEASSTGQALVEECAA